MYKWNQMKRKIQSQDKLIKILEKLLDACNAPRIQERVSLLFCGALSGLFLAVVTALLFLYNK